MMQQADMKVQIVGTVAPPPPPCGGEGCAYVDLDLVHADDCEEK